MDIFSFFKKIFDYFGCICIAIVKNLHVDFIS